MIRILAFAFCIALCYAKTPYIDCGSKGAKVTNVIVKGCDAIPCIAHKKTNLSLEIDFTSRELSHNLTASVCGIIGPICVPLILTDTEKDACKASNIKCPVGEGKSYMYKAHVFIEADFPQITVTAKWELKDDNKEEFVCIEVPLQIKD